jgi:thymidine kinase
LPKKVEIFKPIDTRYDEEMVVSHDANEIRSTPVPLQLILLFWRNSMVGIDEAQFLMMK